MVLLEFLFTRLANYTYPCIFLIILFSWCVQFISSVDDIWDAIHLSFLCPAKSQINYWWDQLGTTDVLSAKERSSHSLHKNYGSLCLLF